MTIRLDSRQSRQRSPLDQLASNTDLRLDVILNLINDELTMPLRMRASSTPDYKLYIDDISVQTTDSSSGSTLGTGRNRTIQPISNMLPSFTAGYMTFPAASGGAITSNNGAGWFQASYTLTVASSKYIKVMVGLDSTGKVVLTFGAAGDSVAAAGMPVALSGTLPIGYVVLYNNSSGVIQNVTNSNIYQFAGGGGGGGSGASAKQVTQNSHGFTVGQAVYLNGSTYALAKADVAATAEAIGIVSNVITANIFEVTELGYVSGLSGLTAGTVYFLSPSSDGALTATEPTTIGHISKPMFIADSSSSGYVLNYRGAVVGGTNARAEVALTNAASKDIYTAPSGLEAAELKGWVYIDATTDYRFHLSAQFAKNGANSDWNIAYQTAGDTPPAGFVVSISPGGIISITLPSVAGFVSAKVNYSINGPAVGATFPLNVDASTITTGTVAEARLPSTYTGTLTLNGGALNKGLTGANATTVSTAGSGYIGEKITWSTPPTSANGVATTTETDWINATFTIGAGVWLIHVSGNVVITTGATSGNDVEAFIKVTDNSNALIGTMVTTARLKAVANVQAVATFPYCIQEVYTTSAASTLLKLRIKRIDNVGTGNTSGFYNEANNYARFFAVRIA